MELDQLIKRAETGDNSDCADPEYYGKVPFKNKLVQAKMLIDRHGLWADSIIIHSLLKQFVEQEIFDIKAKYATPEHDVCSIWGMKISYSDDMPIDKGLMLFVARNQWPKCCLFSYVNEL